MDTDRFASLLPDLAACSRRRLLVAAAAFAPLTVISDARSKKKRRKQKNSSCLACPECPPPLTCAQTCPSSCFNCFIRPGAPTLCGGGGAANCATPSTSDQDCLQNSPAQPYCVSHRVVRSTGEVHQIGELTGVSFPCCVSFSSC
jgi:hypothetical protein